MRLGLLPGLAACACAGLLGSACGSTSRAIVHAEDMSKVFPWPGGQPSVTIRVKPRTTLVNTCYLFGSYEEAEVSAQTTFYMVDELGKNLAYTPSRSPIRRLAPIQSMEIRWPARSSGESGGAADPAAPEPGAGDEAGSGPVGQPAPDAD